MKQYIRCSADGGKLVIRFLPTEQEGPIELDRIEKDARAALDEILDGVGAKLDIVDARCLKGSETSYDYVIECRKPRQKSNRHAYFILNYKQDADGSWNLMSKDYSVTRYTFDALLRVGDYTPKSRQKDLPELTFEESDMGDQLADIFDSCSQKLNLYFEPNVQGGTGKYLVYFKEDEVIAELDYEATNQQMQDIWQESNNRTEVRKQITEWMKQLL